MSRGNGSDDGLLHFEHSPERVVSLVPSMTDSLYELGAGGALVGVTKYCPQPQINAGAPAQVGGTHDFDVEAILKLEPDLVIANQEENSKDRVLQLERAGLAVWIAFPRTCHDAVDMLYTVARLFRMPQAVERIRTLERTLDWTDRAAPDRRPRVFTPIWLDTDASWYMTFNRDTYAHDVLRCCHGDNIFADRQRRYPLAADLALAAEEPPGERDTRYPHVTPEEVLGLNPEIVLLPSEPFPFDESHEQLLRRQLAGSTAVEANRVVRVDGRHLAWHGTHLAAALASLPPLLELT